MFDVPLKDIVDLVLEVKTGALSFEAANPRHEHEWRIWKEVRLPPGKVLMPGLIAHSTNIVEHPELVAERLMRFAECVGRDNLMAGTDCGFSQSPLAGRVHRSIMWAKLRTLARARRSRRRRLGGKRSSAVGIPLREARGPCPARSPAPRRCRYPLIQAWIKPIPMSTVSTLVRTRPPSYTSVYWTSVGHIPLTWI